MVLGGASLYTYVKMKEHFVVQKQEKVVAESPEFCLVQEGLRMHWQTFLPLSTTIFP
jgi:hypothetical protein